jgi:hypothetical protein
VAAGRPLAAELASRPFVVLGIALVLGIAGAAFQLGGAPGGGGADRAAPPRLER